MRVSSRLFLSANIPYMSASPTPLSLDQVADHLERVLLRYEELQKASALLQAQLLEVSQERDSLRSRLAAARSRVDALLMRLPPAAEPRVAAAQDALSAIAAPVDADETSAIDAPAAPGEETA